MRMFKLAEAMLIVMFFAGGAMAETSFDKFQQGGAHNGFVIENKYLNDRDEPFGARFLHLKTGFTLDLFEIQSVPQGFMWVNTPPETDMGRPHTCEHLLLGKGNRGRYVASLEDMSLGRSTAYTSQVYTAYPFSSEGGNEIFYELFEAKLDALLHPNFSDEEIRREVCHIGITEDAETGELSLDEKGTVYTEMISSFEKHWYYIYGAMDEMLYGRNHPLSNNSGGIPAAIREMNPYDLREFHARRYQLNNMGVIVTIPTDIDPAVFLGQANQILLNVDGNTDHPDMLRISAALPEPHSTSQEGEIRMTTYPGSNEQDPGNIVVAWPASLELELKERALLSVFLYCLGGSQTSNLYDKFINSETREIDLGANNVWAYLDDNIGHAISIGITNIEPDNINRRETESLVKMIQEEIANISAYKDGSNELKEFNKRAGNRLEQIRKNSQEYLNSPPGFGLRGGGGGRWYQLLKILEKDKSFNKSLMMKDEMKYVLNQLGKDENIWSAFIDKWNLLSTKPYAVGCKAEPKMLATSVAEKEKRLNAQLAQMKKQYGVATDAEAIARYKVKYDKNTAIIEEETAKIDMPKFLETPPMTLDPQLDYTIDTLEGTIPMVASTFNSMTSTYIGIAFQLDVIPQDQLVYLPLLPQLITQIGVIKDGEVIDYSTLTERLKNEVLELGGHISSNPNTGRVELVVRGAGSNPEETRQAINWLRAGLFHSYLETANLPRIRDVVDSRITGLRNRMKGSEESWVRYPANAYRTQSNPLLLSSYCFLTQEHFMHRLKWRLTEAASEEVARETSGLLDLLAETGRNQSKEILLSFAAEFGEGDPTRYENGPFGEYVAAYTLVSVEAQDIIADALADMAAILPNNPDENVAADWAYLALQIKNDLLFRPTKVLDDLKNLMALITHRDNCRMYTVGNQADREILKPVIDDLVSSLNSDSPLVKQTYTDRKLILDRMRSRYPGLENPTYVGLINNNTRNGVLMYTADCAGIDETDEGKLLDYLAAKLYGGGGAHSMFMKTWSAGLAYSNGLRSSEIDGRLFYYAERCPDVSATMRFVVEELKKAPHDKKLAEYSIAQAFSGSRSSSNYVSRGASASADFADGITPEKVSRFRQNILNLRQKSDLYDILHNRMEEVYGRVLIGYGGNLTDNSSGNYFIVGPEEQFESIEEYISATEGAEKVYRIYPRDYWITD